MPGELMIDEMRPEDWESVARIYGEGIDTGNSTFEQSVPTYERWISAHLEGFSIVARENGEVLGWAALSPVSARQVYRGVAELSLYVGEKHRGKGVGSALMGAMIELSEKKGIWTLQGGTFPENTASLALQKKFGFREVGTRERLGRMSGRWRDVVLTERRSSISGSD
ncbi:GCN5-related N-acetyltransferase family protein [Methanocella paludicola SANAE]|uniref:GCN5-related N-acetyltransferase family protein n=1 Tax=Methanocella paludicola (strain DSM 17711 / JCM 13418 / NBRC 101707 / SANAE) TaxID=304371 RepID=D1Z061_METPS|nr:GNAT family N-acetyltransferase [Methanocella paludicola]BAI62083.1 GCN5-related N-acetyltransferase family protein [Methanocella paludicola SANAE]